MVVSHKILPYWNVILFADNCHESTDGAHIKDFAHVVLDDDVGVLGALRVAKKTLLIGFLNMSTLI